MNKIQSRIGENTFHTEPKGRLEQYIKSTELKAYDYKINKTEHII